MNLIQKATFFTGSLFRIADIAESFQGPHTCPVSVPHAATRKAFAWGLVEGAFTLCWALLVHSVLRTLRDHCCLSSPFNR